MKLINHIIEPLKNPDDVAVYETLERAFYLEDLKDNILILKKAEALLSHFAESVIRHHKFLKKLQECLILLS